MGIPDLNDYRLALHQREQILENEFVTLWYYPEPKIVHHQMLKTPPSEGFRELLSTGADLVEQFRAEKWLSDDRGHTLVREPDELWSSSNWLPRVLGCGFRYWAIVLPHAAIGKLNMHRIAAKHGRSGIVSRFESTPERAFEWLLAQ